MKSFPHTTPRIIFEIGSDNEMSASRDGMSIFCGECDKLSYDFDGEVQVSAAAKRSWPEAFSVVPDLPLIVTQEVWELIEELNISARSDDVIVRDGRPGKYPVPAYRYVTADFGMKIDYEASRFRPGRVCNTCGRFVSIERLDGYCGDFVPDYSSWNGSEIFRLNNNPISSVFCTFRFVELAHEFRWKNLSFRPVLRPEQREDLILFPIRSGHSKNWPPDSLRQFIESN